MSRIARRIVIGAATAALAAGASGVAVPSAFADNVKNCGTTTSTVGPGQSGFTQTTTTTQTSACNSNSDTGQTTTTGPVTNKGGGTPPGQQ